MSTKFFVYFLFVLINYYPGLTMTYFTARSNLPKFLIVLKPDPDIRLAFTGPLGPWLCTVLAILVNQKSRGNDRIQWKPKYISFVRFIWPFLLQHLRVVLFNNTSYETIHS